MEFVALAALTLAGSWLALPLGRGGIATAGRYAQGYLLAAVIVGWIASGFERSGTTIHAWPLFAAVVIAALAAVARDARRSARGAAGDAPKAALVALLVVALAHAALAASTAQSQPPFPWDAWTNWLFRARAWFLEPGVPFSPIPLESAARPVQVPGAHYPAAIPGLVAWLARLGGDWSYPRLLLAWPLAYLAAVFAFGALADHVLRSRATALVAAVLLAATPLVVTHALLAGYADLWTMGAVVLAAGGAFEWRRTRRFDPRIGAAMFLPVLVKIEGLVWLAILLLALALVWRPRVFGIALAALAAVALLAMFAWPGGLHLFSERLVLAPDLVRIPYLGSSPLSLNPVLGPLVRALLTSQTFGVAIWAVLAGGVASFVLRRDRLAPVAEHADAWRVVHAFALLSLAFVLSLFAFTLAGRWALDQTSLSRVVMQLLPVWLLVAARAFEPLDPRATGSISASRSGA
ncbi:MAG TPA: hypothetical protein VND91_05460 [Candidatus Saccharimonadia bacterium]|nr:hypothetical protein [Candidatus Saccharimonadia bacterium]